MEPSKLLDSAKFIASTYLTKHTVQIFDQESDFESFGSGVLVKIADMHFMFTASHVAECSSENKHLFFRIGRNTFLTIDGEYGETRDFDFDLACVRLDDHCVSELSRSKVFLNANQIAFGNTSTVNETLIACGFPSIKTKPIGDELKSTGVYHFVNVSPSSVYKQYQLDMGVHYAVDYPTTGTNLESGETSAIANPAGMSGGGLWKVWIDRILSEEIVKFHLIGLITQLANGSPRTMVATRIEPLMDAIYKKYSLPRAIEKA